MSGTDFRKGALEIAIDALKFRINYISFNDLDCDPGEKARILGEMIGERKELKAKLRKLNDAGTVQFEKFEVVV